jgi:hypothetical protein
MDRDKFEKWMLSYLDKELSETEKREFEDFLKKNDEENAYYQFSAQLKEDFRNSIEVEPKDMLHEGFQAKLDAEINKVSKTNQKKNVLLESYTSILLDFLVPKRLTYTLAVLLCGFLLGNLFPTLGDNQVVQLEERINNLETSIKLAQINSQSPVDRIQGITSFTVSNNSDIQVIDILSEKIKNDENLHVQLAALNALKSHIKDPYAKEKMVDALQESDELFLKILLMQIIIEWDSELVKKEARTILSKDTLNTKYRTVINKLI